MAAGHVEQSEGGYYIAGAGFRLTLSSMPSDGVNRLKASSESFPALSLGQGFGAVAFYLAHRETIEAYLRDARAEFARMRDEARCRHPALHSTKLEAARTGRQLPVHDAALPG
jgi:hypothetical protein